MTPKKISVDTFKSNFDEILRRVERGESFTVTSEGIPVAEIMPSRTINGSKTQVVINSIMAVKKNIVSDQGLIAPKAGRK